MFPTLPQHILNSKVNVYNVFTQYTVYVSVKLGKGEEHILSYHPYLSNTIGSMENKDQESIQSSTTPNPGYHMGKY